MTKFLAWYEDAAKVEAAAKARGFKGQDGESWHDFVEADSERLSTFRQFKTFDAAVAWLTAECRAVKTVYGAGTIRRLEPPLERCGACTCRGLIATYEWTVADDGVEQGQALDSPCI